MRVLIVLNTPGFLRYYDETIEALLARGHEVVLGFTDAQMRAESLDVLAARNGRLRVIGQVPDRRDRYAVGVGRLRTLVDFVRYLDPTFARAQWLRDRRRLRLLESRSLARVFGEVNTLPRPLVRALVRALTACEQAVPSASEIEQLIREIAPDSVLVSPLVTGASPQTDYVKSARALGIPSGVCIASWDNLTNKGLIRERPDRVFVWNDAQRREAIELHGIEPARVVTTGAQPFDRWFGREPTVDRMTFCERVGLDPELPYVLFVGSTSNIADSSAEDRFVRRWIEALRASDDVDARSAAILVRPHPDRRGAWTTEALVDLAGAVVWPPQRPNSVAPAARGEYFDSLFHAAAIVGINTSAMVEAAIIDRPVLTVQLPELEQAQRGTLHFDHLLPAYGGPLFVAGSLTEHARQVGALLRDPALASARNSRFVGEFIRPFGISVPSTPRLVAAVEQHAEVSPDVARDRLAHAIRPLLLLTLRADERIRTRRRKSRFHGGWRRAKRLSRWLQRVARIVEPVAPPLANLVRRLSATVLQRAAVRKAATKAIRNHEKVRRRAAARRLKRRAGVPEA